MRDPRAPRFTRFGEAVHEEHRFRFRPRVGVIVDRVEQIAIRQLEIRHVQLLDIPHHSGRMPASCTTLAHFAMSALMTPANSAGEFPIATAPSAARCFANSGDRTTCTISPFSSETMGWGVPAGASMPF